MIRSNIRQNKATTKLNAHTNGLQNIRKNMDFAESDKIVCKLELQRSG